MTNEELEILAKKHYQDDGQNQWPHIQRVLQQAEAIAAYKNKPLRDVDLASVYFHDIDKKNAGNVDHGVHAATIAGKLLRKHMSKRKLGIITNAIAAHNIDKPSKSYTADLLRSADANKPDLGWFLRKSYNKMTKKGLTHEEAIDNALRIAKKGAPVADQLKNRPVLYQEAFNTDIQRTRRLIKALKREQVWNYIQEYEKKHPEESKYT